ncbi:MAG: MIP family channel protein [Proteobacteria bacterium]|nr:MIP family channel protein [Pseudomonadota bacterium]MCH9012372.1 MIP family channel protein [Pseudomonadota bacterium]
MTEQALNDPAAAPAQETRAARESSPRLRFWPALAGEFMGTFILVFFGVGAVNAAVATGAQAGLWQVAVVWAFGVSLGIYTAASLSGAHINPAITAMAAVYDRFPPARVVPYWVAQTAGAACASLVLYAMFADTIVEFERQHGLLRGGPGSELSAMMFGEYFPNPAIFGTAEEAWRVISERSAFIAEMIGTAMLAFLVSAVTHPSNAARPPPAAQAVVIGVGVAAIISVLAPLTQAALNPARDFGPRLVSYFLGWDEIAIPGPRGGWLTVYIIAPTVGAIIGGGIYRALAALMPRAADKET